MERRKIRYTFAKDPGPEPGPDRPGPAAGPEKVLTVGELTRGIRRLLESSFGRVAVSGEVCAVSQPQSGHVYFTLRDDRGEAQISAVLWRDDAVRLRFRLEEGLRVIARGRIAVYEPRGCYQVVADSVEPAGRGDFALAFDRLKGRLAGEGLFDAARKRPLPFLPRVIGIVTSPTGAALHDILRAIYRRHPAAHVRIVPVPVQGEAASRAIAGALEFLGRPGAGPEVVIVGRGGGSPEDLWTFNEEILVRAVAASRVPVISAVGHETDFTLCDFAADARAQTPTHAGEMVVPDVAKLAAFLGDQEDRLRGSLRRALVRKRERADHLGALLRLRSPAQVIDGRIRHLDDLARRLQKTLYTQYMRWQDKIHLFSGKLKALSPFGVLERGFAVVFDSGGKVVRKSAELHAGEQVRILFKEGAARAAIREVERDHGG